MMFENIMGHDEKKTYFEEVINKHNISHSYIFFGEDGIGKLTFAKELAKYILNTSNLDSCPDFKLVSRLEDKKDIIIEQIRKEIIDDVYIAPISGDHKVYIINDADHMNIAAQNSLLKTLEEPPKSVVIILICSNINKILTTILSRTNKINFEGLDNKSVNQYIKDKFNINLSSNILEYINGSVGKAINIVENELMTQFEEVDKMVDYVIKKDSVSAMKISQNIKFDNLELLEYLEYILYSNKMYNGVCVVERAISRLKRNGNYDIVIDNMILKIIDEI